MAKICEAPDTSPGVWGHKCNLPPHPRKIAHRCGCGHTWKDPIEPEAINVRTVNGDLTL